MTVLLIVGIVVLLVLLIWGSVEVRNSSKGGDADWSMVYALLFAIGLVCFTVGLWNEGYKVGIDRGQINSLKGIQTHEIYYVYPKGSAIPSDTLYLKIER